MIVRISQYMDRMSSVQCLNIPIVKYFETMLVVIDSKGFGLANCSYFVRSFIGRGLKHFHAQCVDCEVVFFGHCSTST